MTHKKEEKKKKRKCHDMTLVRTPDSQGLPSPPF